MIKNPSSVVCFLIPGNTTEQRRHENHPRHRMLVRLRPSDRPHLPGTRLAWSAAGLERGWKVIATMRNPRSDVLPASEHLRVMALDVTDADSIRQLVEAAGPIDVLVNNAGIGLMSVLEGTTMQTVLELFETNTFGTIAMTQAIVPQFRQRQDGVIVNISSSTTLKPLPLLAACIASKAAVNAFTESLALELEALNVRVRLVIPGAAPETAFGRNAQARMQDGIPAAYAEFAQGVFARRGQSSLVTHAQDVTDAVWHAVTDPSGPLRMLAGADAVAGAR